MKIAYLLRVRPDLEDITPDDVEGIRIQVGDDGLYSDEDLAKLAEVDAFVIGMEPVNEQILAAAPNLKIVQRLGVGYETLDLDAIAKRGIPACNLEGVNKEGVAEHSMAFMLALAKKLNEAQAHTKAADWLSARKLTSSAFELKGKTLGIIGFGNTGSSLAKRAHAFEMNLLYNDIDESVNADLAQSLGARQVDKETLYREADFINISVNLNDTSRKMINADALAMMRPEAMLICCARGGVVDEQALADALTSKRLAAAAIDVYEVEPILPDNPLLAIDNCLMTAHVAGVASDTTARIWEWAHDNVRAVVQRGERPRFIRNGV